MFLVWAWVPHHDPITCGRVARPVYVAVLPCVSIIAFLFASSRINIDCSHSLRKV